MTVRHPFEVLASAYWYEDRTSGTTVDEQMAAFAKWLTAMGVDKDETTRAVETMAVRIGEYDADFDLVQDSNIRMLMGDMHERITKLVLAVRSDGGAA